VRRGGAARAAASRGFLVDTGGEVGRIGQRSYVETREQPEKLWWRI